MEFEKGKYYEVVSNIGTKAIFQYLWVNTFVITYCEDKHLIGLDSKLDKEDKVINTFDNIHEVSKRIKEIEEKQKFVGLIYECDLTNLDIGSYDHSIIEVVEANYITEQGFDGKVKILKNISVNEEDKHEYKEGNILDYSVMFEYSKELTKEQYEQRLKELEKDEQEKQIKELQEENKQLRKALEFHGVWPSEDQRAVGNYNESVNLKEASEKAGKEYGEAINMVTDLGVVSVTKKEPSEEVKAILPKVNKLYEEAIASIPTFDFDTGMITDLPKNIKVNDKEHVLTPNYKDGLLQEVHEIVLQLKEKYLS